MYPNGRAKLVMGTLFVVALSTDAGADLVIRLSLVGTAYPGFRVQGAEPGDYCGKHVSGAGDVDGDGVADVAIASAGYPFQHVVFGGLPTASFSLPNIGGNGFEIANTASQYAVRSLSGIGDMDGDGFSDILIGCSNSHVPFAAGGGYIIFGKPGSARLDVSEDGLNSIRIDGTDERDNAGESVSGVGDINGDGIPDVALGAPYAEPDQSVSQASSGECYVVFGKADRLPVSLEEMGESGFLIEGFEPNGKVGRSVAGAGDVNGDGLSDLIVGGGSTAHGDCYVVFGKADTASVDLSELTGKGFRIPGSSSSGRVGEHVSGAGDVNGDGLADILLGKTGSGRSSIIFGQSIGDIVYLDELSTGGFHISLRLSGRKRGSCAGDVNGDGLSDVILGDCYADGGGRSYVVYGKSGIEHVNLDSLGEGGFRLDGAVSSDFSGNSVSGAGDVNGDGLSDVMVGAPGYAGSPMDRGNAYVIYSPVLPTTQPVSAPMTAVCRAFARSGNAPRLAVGICGDGSDDDSPWSRCWIDFDGGQGPGNKNSSLQTVTLTRDDAGIRILKPEHLANVQWHVQSNRTGWRRTRVTLKYTDAEIAGLDESTLRVWRASSPRGPWALYSHGMVREPQRNRIGVSVPALGYFVIEGEPAP